MGQEIKGDARFWGRRIQADALCRWSIGGESHHTETRGGVDGAARAFGCPFKLL